MLTVREVEEAVDRMATALAARDGASDPVYECKHYRSTAEQLLAETFPTVNWSLHKNRWEVGE